MPSNTAAASIRQLLIGARARMHEPRDAALLLAHVLQRPAAWLVAHDDAVPDAEALARFDALLARRIAGEPVAYLLGSRGFWSLELTVTPDTLIPRAETERLVELALARLAPDSDAAVADLGTGSGAIALAIAAERPRAQVVGVDASAAALIVARGNAERLQLCNTRFVAGDWFVPLAGERFAMVLSNPPYLADDDPHLGEGDLRFEPRCALASGTDGLAAIRHLVAAARTHLLPGGWLLLEHGWMQGEAVRALLHDAGYVAVFTAQDLEARDRVSGGRWFD